MISRIRPWWKLFKFAIVLIGYFLLLMVAIIFSGKNHKRGFIIRRNFCKVALAAFNIKVNLLGKPKSGPGLFISNHRSMLDPLVELSFMDVFILSKSEVGDYPLIGKGAKETGVFFVDRQSDNSRKAALQSIEKLLSSGSPILIYPEGTTNNNNLTAEFRKGAFEVAFNNRTPVIPVMIEYPDSSYYWGDEPLMGYFKRIFSMPGSHTVIVRTGDEIFAGSPDELVSRTKAEIDRMILETRNMSG